MLFLAIECLLISTFSSLVYCQDLKELFHESRIVPDVIAKTPGLLLDVKYPGLGSIVPGKVILI